VTTLSSWIYPVVLAPVIGSFLGVLVTRAETPRAIVFGRSRCEACSARLTAVDLVPILSWLALRGRCRRCDRAIGILYPVLELAAVGVAIASAMVFSGWSVWMSCLLGWALLALAATDFKYYLLPDFLTLPLIVAGLLVSWQLDHASLLAHAIGAACGLAFVIGLRRIYRRLRGREGMGLGDAKLFAAAGGWVSWDGLPSVMLLAALSGLAFGLLKGARDNTVSLTDRVPFGAFLSFGIWIVWLSVPVGLTAVR
jgi:leader peptidase (prepilin peptidase)/N-methyltransferase